VRQNFRFADGFFQICSYHGHPCQSLMFPINAEHTGTCILPAHTMPDIQISEVTMNSAHLWINL